MNKQLAAALIIILIICISGCYYDVEEEIYPTIECNTDNVTYSEVVFGIISTNCYTCHSAAANFGNVTLEGYSALKTYVDSGQLLGVIRHESGYSPMPKNQPQLVACDIEKIENWVADGAPNN